MFIHSNAERYVHGRLILLFYTLLFFSSFILVLAVLWLLRLIASFSQRIYKNRLPNEKQGPTAHLNKKKYGKNVKLASRAWGRKPHATPTNLARTHPAKTRTLVPWGWPGNKYDLDEHRPQVAVTKAVTPKSSPVSNKPEHKKVKAWKSSAGKLMRDSRSGLSGQAYQPSEDARSTFAIDKRQD
ncbi:MAG: hypothetical protein GY727_14660 [Gammaproteobacteria bacterium]|nr:hypothetical protein [Gammaproteobacteria bacterium]